MNNTRRLLKWTVTPFLTIGAVLLLGLLAFTGMYVLYPLIGLAIATFALSVFYEAEIYQQNISSAIDKLIDKNILMQTLGKNTLLELEKIYDTNASIERNCMFLEDYLRLKKLKKKSEGDNERLQKMELWFAKLIINRNSINNNHKYANDALKVLVEHFPPESYDWDEHYDRLRFYNISLIGLSSTAAVLMSLGTIYLLVDTLSILTFLSLSPAIAPFVIVPLSVIAGIAYGLLTYNSLSEFIFKKEIFEWIKDMAKKFTTVETYQDPKNIGLALFGVCVIALNVGLTICTAGTWWTIMNQSRPIWGWLQSGVIKIFQYITPFIIALTTLGFNGQNTIETIKEAMPENECLTHENHLQIEKTPAPFNPFDYLIKFIYFPIRLLMFIGHLISVSVTSDQMPGVSKMMAALFAFISEFLEDGHYFLDMDEIKSILGLKNNTCEEHEHGHQHSDIPNYIIQFILSPLFLSAAAYDYYFNQDLEDPVDFKTCLYNKLKWKNDEDLSAQPTNNIHNNNWLREEARMILEDQLEHLNNCYWNTELIERKISAINAYKEKVRPTYDDFEDLKNNTYLKQHRSWSFFSKTRSQEMIEKLQPLAYKASISATNNPVPRSFVTRNTTNDVTALASGNVDETNTTVHYSPNGVICQAPNCSACPATNTDRSIPGGGWARMVSGSRQQRF